MPFLKVIQASMVLIGISLGGCDKPEVETRIVEHNQALGSGVNLGNALEAPNEGDWGVTLTNTDFKMIAEKGFDSVRLPVRWSEHMKTQAPFTIEPEFLNRVTWAVDQAIENGLRIVLNVHHFKELYRDPKAEKVRFLELWNQISNHFKGYPESLYFEILNEPEGKLKADEWNRLIRETLTVIREQHPERPVLIGPPFFNKYTQLENLRLPNADRNIIVTVHYYLPFHFTHQGTTWVDDPKLAESVGRQWPLEGEQSLVNSHFDEILEWSEKHNRPIHIGEYGAYKIAPMESRVRWTKAVREAAMTRNFSTAYWEYCAGFGLYDKNNKQWHTALVDAVLTQ